MPEFRIDHAILLAALRHPAAGLRHPDIDRAELKMFGKIRPPAGWVPADGNDVKWARGRGLPDELLKVFQDGWPTETTEIGTWSRMWDLASIREEMEKHPSFFEHGLLVVGSALNGDWICMDLRTHPGAIGYIGKDQAVTDYIEAESRFVLVDDLRSEFFEVSPSLGAFALGVVKDSLPIDSYATWSEENENASWLEGVDLNDGEDQDGDEDE